jgi:hypothetical protein
MNPQIKDILRKAEGRYLTEEEQGHMSAYADLLAARTDSMEAIERAESAILDDVVNAVLGAHPEVDSAAYLEGAKRVRRDQALVLRYATFSMLMHDKNFIHDKLAVWLRSILLALCKPEQVLAGYYALVAACERHLTAADAASVVPFIQVVIAEFEQAGGKKS